MPYEALDVDEGGAQWLPFAQQLLRKLKIVMVLAGIDYGRRNYVTPDGDGSMILRTHRIGKGDQDDPGAWMDYIKIETGGGGYIFNIYINVLPTVEVPGPSLISRRIKLPLSGGKFTDATGLDSASPFPFLSSKNAQITAAVISNSKGYFARGKFIADTDATLSVFSHSYTDAVTGQASTRALTFGLMNAESCPLVDVLTGMRLTYSGPALALFLSYTVTASPDGRAVVINAVNEVAEYGQLAVLYMTVDYAATPQVVATRVDTGAITYGEIVNPGLDLHTVSANIVDGYGSETYSQTLTSSVTGDITFPVAYGVGADNALAVITARAEHASSHSSVSNTANSDSGPPVGTAGRVDTTFNRNSSSISTSAGGYGGSPGYITLALPNGNAKQFTLYAKKEVDTGTENGSSYSVWDDGWANLLESGNSFSASGTHYSTTDAGVLTVIYADPSIPVLVYQYDAYKATSASSYQVGASGTGTSTDTQTVNRFREVGILIGAKQRILFTDSVPVEQSGGTADIGYWFLQYGALGGTHSINTTVSTPSFNSLIVTTNYYRKILRYVTKINRLPFFTNNRYGVVVKDENNWVVTVTKLREFYTSVPISTFDIYAAKFGSAKAKSNYLKYLIEATTDDPALAAVHADLLAGNLAPYEMRLHVIDGRSSVI